MTTLVAFALAMWLVLTVANQFEYARAKLGPILAHDVLGLIPVWTFFAPRPGTSDYRIFFRGKNARGESVPWAELELSEARKPWHFLWNPHKRHVVLTDRFRHLRAAARSPGTSTASSSARRAW